MLKIYRNTTGSSRGQEMLQCRIVIPVLSHASFKSMYSVLTYNLRRKKTLKKKCFLFL